MISEEFKKNVELGDIITVRSALVDYLIIDTTFRRFDEALDYAKQLINIIEPDDGKADYDLVQKHWDETYLNKQKVALMVNFSQKRIEHIKLVIKTVLMDNAYGVQNPDVVKESSHVKLQGNRNKTGRTVLSEEAISCSEQSTEANMNTKVSKTISRSDLNQQNSNSLNENRTGRRTMGEKRSSVKKTEEEVHLADIAVWMIGGGITVATIGGVVAGIGAIAVEPAVIHAGATIAGAGVVVAVSGGVIKIVKEM